MRKECCELAPLKHFGRRSFGRSVHKRKFISTVRKSYCNNTQCISEIRGLPFHNLLSVSDLPIFFIIIDFLLKMFVVLLPSSELFLSAITEI